MQCNLSIIKSRLRENSAFLLGGIFHLYIETATIVHMPKLKNSKVDELLTRNVENTIDKKHLTEALKGGKKLRVKLGIDPTGGNVHIGHAVIYWKMREFQNLGHKLIVIIGDFTAQIGDPSDKLNKRPFLTKGQVKENLKNYLPQIGKIVDLKKAEIRYNSEWLAKLDFREVSELAEIFTFQQILERKNFSERLKNNQEISLREALYPLMQGYDSVAVKADVELGGTDQLFNLLAGRKIQPKYGQPAQDIMTMKMLIGLDGRKMSKSWGNTINIADPADEQFGKVMSLHDDLIAQYFQFATRLPPTEIKKHEKELKSGKNPKDIKLILASEIVSLYHGKAAAKGAGEKWERLFSKKDFSEIEIKGIEGRKWASPVEVVLKAGVAKSNSEAYRLVKQGAVKIDGVVKKDPTEAIILKGGELIKIGKRHFFRIK